MSWMQALGEEILSRLRFPKIHPVRIPQYFESQQGNPRIVLQVKGSLQWSSFIPSDRGSSVGADADISFVQSWIYVCTLKPSCLKNGRNIIPIIIEFFHLTSTEHRQFITAFNRGVTHPWSSMIFLAHGLRSHRELGSCTFGYCCQFFTGSNCRCWPYLEGYPASSLDEVEPSSTESAHYIKEVAIANSPAVATPPLIQRSSG